MFLSCRPFVVITTGPVDNVVITTKGLQDRNLNILDGTTVENKGKLILTEIFASVQKHDIFYFTMYFLIAHLNISVFISIRVLCIHVFRSIWFVEMRHTFISQCLLCPFFYMKRHNLLNSLLTS